MDRRLLVTVAVALVAVLIAGIAPRAAAADPVAGTVEGPPALAPGAASPYYVNVTGGPASEGGNFTLKYYLTGTDLTGALPTQSSPGSSQNATGRFRFNVTAPQKEQVVTLIVEVNSTHGARFERTTLSRAITIVTPVVLTATFSNKGGSAAVDVPVRFYVDGTLVGSTNISRIEPQATGTATLTWLPVGLAYGTHSVRVEADLNRNNVIEPDKGEVAVLDVFYKKQPDLSWGWAGAIMAVTILLTILVVRRVRARRKR